MAHTVWSNMTQQEQIQTRVPCTPADQKYSCLLYDLLTESGSSTNLPENLKNATEKAAKQLLKSEVIQ